MIPNHLIDAATFIPRSLAPPNAWVGHMPFAAWLIRQVTPAVFVELGTHSGNSYFSFCQSVAENKLPTRCYAVDTWQGDDHAGSYDENVFAGVDAHNQHHYAGFSGLMRMTFDDAVGYFSDGSIDMLHIDGLHTYGAVKHDFETWLPKLAPGAVVLFHDTNVRERDFGVWQLWEELQEQYPDNIEFSHSHGLGVLQLDHAPQDRKLTWLSSSCSEKQKLKKYFAALGFRQLEQMHLDAVSGERGSQIIQLKQQVMDNEKYIQGLKEQISDLNALLADLKIQLAEKESQINDLFTSTSWRVTRPLRYMRRLSAGISEDVIKRPAFQKDEIPEKNGVEIFEESDLSNPAVQNYAARPLEIDYSASVPFGFEIPTLDCSKIAAVIHLYHEDLAVEFRSYLANVPVDMDIFISTTDAFKAAAIECAFAGWDKGRVSVRIVQNRGRDIASKLVTFKDVYPCYEYVLFLYGKRSFHADVLSFWRHFLLESLLGTSQIVKSVLYAFEQKRNLGIIAPQHYEPARIWINWGDNFATAQKLGSKMGFVIQESDPFDFPAGSMFWVRTSALTPLLDLGLKTEDFVDEPIPTDGTLTHAIERLFFHACEHKGFDWIKIARPEFYQHTPMIVDISCRADLSNYMSCYTFQLLNPRGVKPSPVAPKVIQKVPPDLFNHVRRHALGMDIRFSPDTRVAVGIAPYNNSQYELYGMIHAAKISLKSAGFGIRGALYMITNGENKEAWCQDSDFVTCLDSCANRGFGAAHNKLMQAAFADGFDLYIAVKPFGYLHPGAVKSLVQMVQAGQGKVLVDALQFPAGNTKHYEPNTFDMAISLEAFHDLEGFDERLHMCFEDVDLSWRARAHGYALKTCPGALFLKAFNSNEIMQKLSTMRLESGLILARKWVSEEHENKLKLSLMAAGNKIPDKLPESVPEEWRYHADFSILSDPF
jgi:hypothetical protein